MSLGASGSAGMVAPDTRSNISTGDGMWGEPANGRCSSSVPKPPSAACAGGRWALPRRAPHLKDGRRRWSQHRGWGAAAPEEEAQGAASREAKGKPWPTESNATRRSGEMRKMSGKVNIKPER